MTGRSFISRMTVSAVLAVFAVVSGLASAAPAQAGSIIVSTGAALEVRVVEHNPNALFTHDVALLDPRVAICTRCRSDAPAVPLGIIPAGQALVLQFTVTEPDGTARSYRSDDSSAVDVTRLANGWRLGLEDGGGPPQDLVVELRETSQEPFAPARYVALGDSFASGEGASPFVEGTDTRRNQCHRSSRAGAVLFAGDPGDGLQPLDLKHVACSGSVLADLYGINGSSGEAPQLDALNRDTKIVSISMGGNDLEFAPVLRDCVYRGSVHLGALGSRYTCQRALSGRTDANLRALDTPRDDLLGYTPLQWAYANIRVRAPQATILVVGYPHLFSDDGINVFDPCYYVNKSDQVWANSVVDRGNAIIRRNAESMGATFVNLTAANAHGSFRGHSACDTQPFINRLRLGTNGTDQQKPGPSPESFHPNPAGQAAIARGLRAAYATARSR